MYPNQNYNMPYGLYNQFGPNQNVPQPVQSQVPSQNQGQTIQNLSQSQVDPQAICYFVKSSGDMNSIKAAPFTYYLGINEDKKEIYIRKMKDDGTTDSEKYVLSESAEEKTELQIIVERLDRIEEKLTNKRETLHLKEKKNESSAY